MNIILAQTLLDSDIVYHPNEMKVVSIRSQSAELYTNYTPPFWRDVTNELGTLCCYPGSLESISTTRVTIRLLGTIDFQQDLSLVVGSCSSHSPAVGPNEKSL